jgi:hypothetical protein
MTEEGDAREIQIETEGYFVRGRSSDEVGINFFISLLSELNVNSRRA